jgi:succinylarginine dihydrolase
MVDEAKLDAIAEVVREHWPERVAPADLLDLKFRGRVEAARTALLERLALSELA